MSAAMGQSPRTFKPVPRLLKAGAKWGSVFITW